VLTSHYWSKKLSPSAVEEMYKKVLLNDDAEKKVAEKKVAEKKAAEKKAAEKAGLAAAAEH
jgi:hypothetical protein